MDCAAYAQSRQTGLFGKCTESQSASTLGRLWNILCVKLADVLKSNHLELFDLLLPHCKIVPAFQTLVVGFESYIP